MTSIAELPSRPGVCLPWECVREESPILGDETIIQRIWEENDLEPYLFYWMCVVSF